MERQFLKDLTDAGEVKVNFEKKDLSLRRMKCTTSAKYLCEHAEETGWKPIEENRVPKVNPSILPVWDIENKGWRNIPIAKVVFAQADNKIKYSRFFHIVRKLDESGFTKPTGKTTPSKVQDHAQILHMNLWGMFTTRFTGAQLKEMRIKGGDKFDEPFGCNVSDYGWTQEVEDEFYDHPYNKPIVKAMKKSGGMGWGMFALDAEPSNIDHFDSSPLIEEGFES